MPHTKMLITLQRNGGATYHFFPAEMTNYTIVPLKRKGQWAHFGFIMDETGPVFAHKRGAKLKSLQDGKD